MGNFDLSPLYKTTIGFDRLANMFDEVAGFAGDAPAYPPYNIELLGENEYRLTMAVAGFGEDEITVEVKEGVLTVTGRKAAPVDERTFLHRGIAARNFERRFRLADHVEVAGATLENGLLHVELKRELPEAMKPRTIKISSKRPKGAVIEEKVTQNQVQETAEEKAAA